MLNFEAIMTLLNSADGMTAIRSHPEWISADGWMALCTSPFFIDMIEENKTSLDSGCWLMLSSNESALRIIEENQECLDGECWLGVCFNKGMIPIIEQMDLRGINEDMFFAICTNEGAIHLIEPIIGEIEQYCITAWTALSMNKAAIPLIEKYGQDKMTEFSILQLSEHQDALHLVKRHEDFIGRCAVMRLIQTRNPEADPIIKTHLNKLRDIDFEELLHYRPEFGPVLIANRDTLVQKFDLHIHYNLTLVSGQPTESRKELFAQLRFLPRFVEKWIADGGEIEDMS